MKEELNNTQPLIKDQSVKPNSGSEKFLYELKDSLLTETEKQYLTAIKNALPEGYFVQPQVNLASIINKTNGHRFQNELYRNIDACIFDLNYKPVVLIEINDNTHNDPKRKARDTKVKMICEEAGIPLVRFWTSYGIKEEYINKVVAESIETAKAPVRIAHSQNNPKENAQETSKPKKQGGCYIATAIYGSYDCPPVWTLRRFRDDTLSKSYLGKVFIKFYYGVSPLLVAKFSGKDWFNAISKKLLNQLVTHLQGKGYSDGEYKDQ